MKVEQYTKQYANIRVKSNRPVYLFNKEDNSTIKEMNDLCRQERVQGQKRIQKIKHEKMYPIKEDMRAVSKIKGIEQAIEGIRSKEDINEKDIRMIEAYHNGIKKITENVNISADKDVLLQKMQEAKRQIHKEEQETEMKIKQIRNAFYE